MSCFGQDTDLPRIDRAFSLMFRDSIPMEVDLVFDEDVLPELYRCKVNTPVCEDTLCRVLMLDVYWDLLGNFTHFRVPETMPLTKWDHLEFTREDYLKLSEILKDNESVLGTVQDVNALFDPSTKKISEKVDAVTGATRKTIQNAVVGGAVYSSYTLWHVVNGEIPASIRQFTRSYIKPALINKFLLSDNYHYHYEALNYLIAKGYEGHFNELVEMLGKSSPFVSRRAVLKFPQTWLENERFQFTITKELIHLDYLTQEIWLDRLMEVHVYESTLESLTGDHDRYSQNQLLQVLRICDNNLSMLDGAVITNLGSLLRHESEGIAVGTHRIFEKLSRENRNAKKILKAYEKSQDL